MKVGALTIGESPRSDVLPELRSALGPDVNVLEKGVLDGLDTRVISRMAPSEGEPPLVTRMRDGTEVRLAKRHVRNRLRACIAEFESTDVDVVIVLCTADFPRVRSEKLLLLPYRILRRAVQGLLSSGRLGVVVPAMDQISEAVERWRGSGLDVVAEFGSPYSGAPYEMRAAAEKLGDSEVDLVVLDCIGYGGETKALFRRLTGKPVLLPRSLVGRIARELIEE